MNGTLNPPVSTKIAEEVLRKKREEWLSKPPTRGEMFQELSQIANTLHFIVTTVPGLKEAFDTENERRKLMAEIEQGVKDGTISVNDARQKLGLPPIDETEAEQKADDAQAGQ